MNARTNSFGREQLAVLGISAGLTAASAEHAEHHYTDAGLAKAIWTAVWALRFHGGRVVEHGGGAGYFIAFVPGVTASWQRFSLEARIPGPRGTKMSTCPASVITDLARFRAVLGIAQMTVHLAL